MRKILVIIVFFTFSNHLFSDEIDCSKLDKLSADYAKCIAKKSKDQGKLINIKLTKI